MVIKKYKTPKGSDMVATKNILDATLKPLGRKGYSRK